MCPVALRSNIIVPIWVNEMAAILRLKPGDRPTSVASAHAAGRTDGDQTARDTVDPASFECVAEVVSRAIA